MQQGAESLDISYIKCIQDVIKIIAYDLYAFSAMS